MILADVQTGCFYNPYVYVRKDSDGIGLDDDFKNMPRPTQAVMRLAALILNSNSNITADYWFTSVNLAQALKKKGLTYVGTLRENKQEVPQEFQAKRSREVSSTLYSFTKDLTLVRYPMCLRKTNVCSYCLACITHLQLILTQESLKL